MRDHSSHSAELNHGSLFNIDAKVANGTWQWEAEREKLDCEIKLQESCKKKAEAKAGNHQHLGTRLKEGSARQAVQKSEPCSGQVDRHSSAQDGAATRE